MFFTLGLPLIMLVLFNALFGNSTIDTPEGSWSSRQFYTGGLAAFTAASATFTNLANMVPIRRDEGVLKRWRGTPLPTWIYIAGFICSAIVIAFVGVTIMLTVGVVAYDLDIDPAKMPAAFVTFLVGVASFAALGMALASLVKSASSSSAAANAIILPLAFVSNIFIQLDDPPRWIEVLRQRLSTQAVRRGVPGLLHSLRRATGLPVGQAGVHRRLGCRRAVRRPTEVLVGTERQRTPRPPRPPRRRCHHHLNPSPPRARNSERFVRLAQRSLRN